MNAIHTLPSADGYAEPATGEVLRFERLLPGPIERVWEFLVDGDLRRQWLASGDMRGGAGTAFELVWRNDELTDPPGDKPEGFGAEHRMQGEVLACDPPRRLAFTWGGDSDVAIDLAPRGDQVLLTLTHRRLGSRERVLMHGAGWHAHLDVLGARLSGAVAAPFWDRWLALKAGYDARLPH
jgi:uncharacterized protein YndB with AHSA1/START domain